MAGEWRIGHLGDCVLLQSGGTPSKSRLDFWLGDVPWVSAKDMKSYWIKDTEDHLSENGAKEATRIVAQGTTLLLVRGMTLHNDIPICRVRRPAAFNQDVKAALARPGTDPEFVPYLLLGYKTKLLSIVDSAGHGTGRLNSDTLLNLPVHIPPVEEQCAIAHILGTLDEKIELNRRMNETLEAMARAIFKSWFIDFDPVRRNAARTRNQPSPAVSRHPLPTPLPLGEARVRVPGMGEGQGEGRIKEFDALFPDHFGTSELGEIPGGWEVVTLPEVIEVNPARSLKKGQVAPYLDMANMPSRGHSPDVVVERPFGSGMRFINGDTLVARITPCLENGKTAFVDFLEDGQVGWGSTEYMVLRPKAPLPAVYAYCLARSGEFREFAIQSMTGTSGRQRVPAEALSHFLTISPPDDVAELFGRLVKPLFTRAHAATEESRTLTALRDTLLPKLISGELRIRTGEKIVQAHS
ncbi:MAG: restriction endonuclease subunit S [Deltaproteobacteria bacterium]|nr:restriction endonuclease subunit S [Deltaproteobacteria bacterium]